MVAMRKRHPVRPPAGITSIELLVVAGMLMAVMTFATTLCFRVNQIWQDVAHSRIALGELSNQLESLTRMPLAEVRRAAASLEPSAECARTLSRPVLECELAEDGDLGTRIVLRLNWDRRFRGKPVELTGWTASGGTDEVGEGGE